LNSVVEVVVVEVMVMVVVWQ